MVRAAPLAAVLALAVATPASADPDAGPPAPPAPVTPAPLSAASLAVTPAEAPVILARLVGQRARVVAGRLVIDDIAGEGRPWVGVIERHGAELWLRTDDGPLRLAGPLARPRVAGPGYRAWAIGAVTAAAPAPPGTPPTMRLRRLGILARP